MKLNWANRITILRILLVAPFVGFMLKTNDARLSESAQDIMRYIAIVFFIIMAISDSIDGYLARRKNQITRLGVFLDPVADKLLITCACVLLASRRGHVDGFIPPSTVIVCIIGKDLLLLIGFIIVYFITSHFLVAPVFIGKLATALQLSMIGGILIAPEVSNIFPWWIWLLRLIWWSAAGAAVLATLVYIHRGIRYIEEHE